MVALPAFRRLCTQLTSPKGASTQRPPEPSPMVMGVVRGKPLRRPRTVINALGPIGTPAASRRRAMGLNHGTHLGMCRELVCAAAMEHLTLLTTSLISAVPYR